MIRIINNKELVFSNESMYIASVLKGLLIDKKPVFIDEKPTLKKTLGMCYDMSFEDCLREAQEEMKYQGLEKLYNKLDKQLEAFKFLIEDEKKAFIDEYLIEYRMPNYLQ